MIKVEKCFKIIDYTILFILLFLDSSFILSNNGNGTLIIGINLISTLYLLIKNKVKKYDKDKFFFFIFLILMVSISGLIYENFKQTFIILSLIFSSFVISNVFKYNKFKEIFIKLMYFLAIYSLISYGISIVFPKIITLFPILSVAKTGDIIDYSYYNLFFSVVSTNKYLMRNYGFFWEPGAYSIFLCIALLMEISNENINFKKVFVFLVAVITTFSTLGIICGILLIIYLLLKKDKGNKKLKKMKVIFIILGILTMLYLITNGDYFIYHVFGKLQKNAANTYSSTTLTRYNAIVVPFKYFINNFIFGIGYNNYLNVQKLECLNMATCTYMNFLCIYGIFGLIPIINNLRFFINFERKNILKIILLLLGIIIFSTENFIQLTFFYVITFYGFDSFKKRSLNNHE